MINSKIVLGTVQMGLDYGINNKDGQITKKDSFSILEESYKLGVRFLDTAEAYGNAHNIIGEFHKQFDKKFNILTKFPHNFDLSAEEKCIMYINELEVVELYGLSFHSYNSYKEYFKTNRAVLNQLIEKGFICKIGVSVYTNEEFLDVIEDDAISIIQLPFNLLDNMSLRGEFLKKAKELGKEIHVRSVFLQGLFFSDLSSEKSNIVALRDELYQLQNICKKYDITMYQLAMNYVMHNSFIDKVLIGVDSVKQLKENMSCIMTDFPNEIIDEVEKIKVSNVNLLNPSLWNIQK